MSLNPIAERYVRADNLDDVLRTPLDESSAYFAGGTDMVPLQRSGVTSVETLVDVKATGLDRSIERHGDRWRIGALTTLAELEDHDGLADDVGAVRAALRQVATRQIRNRATIGGNLLQRPRCSYFRDAQIDCWMKGGDGCPARDGLTEYLGVVPNDSPCIAVQPSDLASVLVMAGASVEISSASGTRHVDVADLLAGPTPDRRSLHSLKHGEIIRSVTIPTGNHSHSTYVKAMDRAVWQFALVGLAASVTLADDGTVSKASLVASGVGSVPHVLAASAAALVGKELDDETVRTCADLAVDGLRPSRDNGYKLSLLTGLVRRSLG